MAAITNSLGRSERCTQFRFGRLVRFVYKCVYQCHNVLSLPGFGSALLFIRHSCLRAVIGSTLAARRAGSQQANRPMPASTITTIVKLSVSRGDTS